MVRLTRFTIFLLLEKETTLLDIAKRRVVKTQTNASHVEVCNIVRNHANSEMPRVITLSGKVIFVRCVKPYRHEMKVKERSSGQKNVRLNSCKSNSDDEIVERDNHVSDTPVDADEVGAFGFVQN